MSSQRDIDVVQKMKKCLDIGLPIAERHRIVARINEAFVLGQQWERQRTVASETTGDSWFDDENVPRIHVNECQGLMTTWSSLLNKDRRSAVATPASERPEDIYRSELTNKFIDFFIGEEETATKTHQSVQYAFQDGTAGLKHWYDPFQDRIRWELLTIHTYVIEPRADWRDAQWVIFDNYYDEDEVADLWAANNITDVDPPQAEEYKNSAGDTVTGILGQEFWHRPTKSNPRGFYACIIKGQVVEMRDYPYVVKDDSGKEQFLLPLSLMKVRNVRDSSYGRTPMTDVVPLQRSLNEMVSRILKLVRIGTNPQLVVDEAAAEGYNPTTSNMLTFNSKNGEKKAGDVATWTQSVQISPELFSMRDYFNSAMNDVVGLNDLTVGTENRSLSGRAIDAIFELDAQKNADASKSLDDMVLHAWRVTLALVQLYYTNERKAEISDGDIVDVISFTGADIQGKNIRLESGSEVDKRTDVRAGAAAEQLENGMGTAIDLERAQKTPAYAAQRRTATRLLADYLAGNDVEVNDRDVNLEVLVAEIERAKTRALSAGKRADYVDLMKLQHFILEELPEETTEEPDAPGAEPVEATNVS